MKKAISVILALCMVFSMFVGTISTVSATNGNTYYVSNSGSDANDGSQANPWKTIEKVNSASLESGDKVLFKCGDEWRGVSLVGKNGVSYGSYGTGEKPILNGSSQNYADVSLWATTETEGIYKLNVALANDVGGVVFNNGEAWGIKDQNNIVNTDENLSFYYDGGYVYILSLEGNPAELYDSIELIEYGAILTPASNSNISGISFKYKNFGISGIDGISNVSIDNCSFFGIGGCKYSETLRYGNAIEFYGSAKSISVTNCEFSQIFDTAITAQSSSAVEISDITISGNKIDRSHWGIELWVDDENGIIKDITISNNTFTNTAKNWGSSNRWSSFTTEGAHISNLSVDKSSKSNISIVGNDFGVSGAQMLHLTGEGWNLSGNTYRQYENKSFGIIGEAEYNFNDEFINNTLSSLDATAKAEKVDIGNAVVNGDFENETDYEGWIVHPSSNDWRITLPCRPDENDGTFNYSGLFYTGRKTLCIRHNWTNIRQENIALEPETDYVFSFYIRRVNVGNSTLAVSIENYSSEVLAKVEPTESTYFKKYSVEFNSGANTKVKLYVRGDKGSATYNYLDDFSIQKVEEEIVVPVDDENLLINPGFENGTNGWTMQNATVSKDASVAHSGEGFFNINQNYYSNSYQEVTLTPNTDYEYSFWYNVTEPSDTEWNFKLSGLNGTFAKLNATGGKWVKHMGTFNSGDLTSTKFVLQNNNEHKTFFIDDCEIKEKKDILLNGDFEDESDFNGWIVHANSGGRATLEKNNNSGIYDGKNTLKIAGGGWSNVRQENIALEKNTDYELSFYARLVGQTNTSSLEISIKNGDGSIVIASVKPTASSEFKKYILSFNSGSNDTVRLYVVGDGGNGSSSFAYIDNFVIGKADTKNVILNGNFESEVSYENWIVHNDAVNRVAMENGNNSYLGGKTIRIDSGWTNVRQENIKVLPNTDYTLSFYCKRVNVSASTKLDVTVETYSSPSTKLVTVSPVASSAFQKYSVTFNSGDNTSVKVYMRGDGSNSNYHSYLDDFRLERVKKDNILKNGSFENGIAGWTFKDKSAVYADSSKSYDSDRYYRTTDNGWTVAVQNVTLKKYALYEYSFVYRATNPTATSFVALDGFESTKTTFADTNGEWVKVTGTFRSGLTTSAKFRIEANGTHGDLMIDECSISEVDPLIGDIDGDASINGVDLTVLRKYLLCDHADEFIEANSDVNIDGALDICDLIRLKKSLVEKS